MRVSRRRLSGKVRIIGGLWKRSKLAVPYCHDVRPTPDRVRETLFNWLGQSLSGWRCLDAFAGTGALGFEAASRGAIEVLLLEIDSQLQHQLRESQQRLKAVAVRVEGADALAWMARSEAHCFDLVFLDPPFSAGLHEKALAASARLLAPGGFVFVEAPHALPTQTVAAHGLRLHKHHRSGTVHSHLLQKTPS